MQQDIIHIPSPLTAVEKEHLLTIYYTRRRFFTLPYLFIVLYALYNCLSPIQKGAYYVIPYDNPEAMGKSLGLFLVLLAPLIFFGLRIYRKRILCFKKDAEAGVKERITKIIVRKSYFPLTNQYFISFDDPDYMHHEVDSDFYNSCSEGGEAYLYRAPRSKYIFNKNGVFSLV